MLVQLLFTITKAKLDLEFKKLYTRVAEHLKTYNLRKQGIIREISKLHREET